MIAQIASSRIDYEGKQIFEATVYTDGQLGPPVLIADTPRYKIRQG